MEGSEVELRSVLKNFNLLNLCLIAVSLLFAFNFLFPQMDSNVTFVLPSLKKKPMEKTQIEAAKAQTPSPMDYVVVADQNLFHPERKIPPEKKEEAALPKPDFILFGTLITPNLKMAYLEDKKAPVSTPGRGKRQVALKKGESLSGYTVKEIMANKVIMARGEETLTVLLEDPKAPKTREAGVATSSQPQAPGAPGTPGKPAPMSQPQAPQMGQPSKQPISPGQGAFPGMPVTPTPMPSGIGPPPMPSAPPGGGTSPTFPSRRSRAIQPTMP